MIENSFAKNSAAALPQEQTALSVQQRTRALLRLPFSRTFGASEKLRETRQVNGQIQAAYAERGRYDELAEEKYTDPGAIFDIMAITVILQNLHSAPTDHAPL